MESSVSKNILQLLIIKPKQFSCSACAFAVCFRCKWVLAPIPLSVLEKRFNGFTPVRGCYGLFWGFSSQSR